MPIRLGFCIAWILGALLVMATVDTRPDPPALNPTPGASTLVQSHSRCCQTPALLVELPLVADHPFFVNLFAAGTFQGQCPADHIVLTGQAADPSPPRVA